MSRLLLVAQPGSYRIAPYLNAARRMGLEVLVASHGEYSLISELHDGLHIDLDDFDSALANILREARKAPFTGILGSDDSTVELAASAAEQLGLPHNPPQAARLSRRKDLARAQLAVAGCPVPVHYLIDLDRSLQKQMAGLPWPCVIKPLHLSASRGVIRADKPAEFIAACERIKSIISDSDDDFERTHLLVEDYIDGVEVAYEGYLHNGELTTLALFDKPDPLQGPYFEETIYVTPSQLDETTQAGIKRRVAQACAAYGLSTGPVHAELRINKQDAWLLEVASRTIGGDCARTLDQGTDFNLEELTISLATGKPVNTQPPEEASGVMMIPIKHAGILRRVEGISAARKVAHIEKVDIIIRDGNELIPLPEGNQYPGYIFARGNSSSEVIDALREAHAHLNFVVAPVFRIERP
ncbi:MAG: ATP-grasp domain-containing protein [Thiogranum sp.]